MAAKKKKSEKASKKEPRLSKAEKVAIPIIIIIAAWAVYSFTQPSSTPSPVTPTVSLTQSAAAPDFTLPVVGPNGLTGQTVTLSSFRGKVVVLEFMVPWCPHCQDMASVLNSVHARFNNGNVTFISVAAAWDGASANDAANFIRSYGTNWIYVYDSSNTVFNSFGVSATPTFFIIGKDGSVSSIFNGSESSSTLSDAISAALSA